MNRELWRLAVQATWKKKRGSMLLFLVLLVSFSFSMMMLMYTGSIELTNEEYRFDTYGTWYGAIPDGKVADESWLSGQDWLDELGVCVSYGSISAGTSGGGIGTVDEAFLEIGRIQLEDGTFPEAEDEIAMEADLLSALGYDYTLGQKITATVRVTAGDVTLYVEQTWTLCGVLKEYTDLWSLSNNKNNRLLNSAIISEAGAERLLAATEETAAEYEELLAGVAADGTESSETDIATDGIGSARLDLATDETESEETDPTTDRTESVETDPTTDRTESANTNSTTDETKGAETDLTTYESGTSENAQTKAVDITPDSPVREYFFIVKEGEEETMIFDVHEYLLSSRAVLSTSAVYDTSVCVNTTAYQESMGNDYHIFYVVLIFAITFLAVLCIYTVQLPDEVHHIALFRGIGAAKGQIRLLLFYETGIVCIPACLGGALLGAAGTWLMLAVAVYSGSATVHVQTDFPILLAAGALWLIGVVLARLIVLQVAFTSPLTGRFRMQTRRRKGQRFVRRGMIAFLTAMLCAAATFTVMESLDPGYRYRYWSAMPSYVLWRASNTNTWNADADEEESLPDTVTKAEVNLLRDVPGISNVAGFGELEVSLSFEGMEKIELVNAYAEIMGEMGDEDGGNLSSADSGEAENASVTASGEESAEEAASINVTLYMIDPDDNWESTFDLEGSGIDLDAFESGNCVAVMFPTLNGTVTYDGTEYEDTGIQMGDTIYLTPDGVSATDSDQTSDIANQTESTSDGAVSVTVGGVLNFESTMFNRMLSTTDPYVIVCSEAFLEKLLDTLPEGTVWGKYRSGEEIGYSRVYLYADQNAGYLSTDATLAQIATGSSLSLSNRRSEYASYVQQYLQSLLMILISGGAVILMLLLILSNTIRLDATHERRSCGILQALGMSVRQLRAKILRSAVLHGIFATVGGWLIYAGYLVYSARALQESWLERGTEKTFSYAIQTKISSLTSLGGVPIAWIMTFLEVLAVLLVFALAKRKLISESLMGKLD
ncbi:MAG: ABC transporter permease [Lachnospiraceae bacterium]|nr:ABC transporter permease [Lachnospiraceae bacterium]